MDRDWDVADSYALLDDHEVLIVSECCVCLKDLKACVCNWEEEPESSRSRRPSPRRPV